MATVESVGGTYLGKLLGRSGVLGRRSGAGAFQAPGLSAAEARRLRPAAVDAEAGVLPVARSNSPGAGLPAGAAVGDCASTAPAQASATQAQACRAARLPFAAACDGWG